MSIGLRSELAPKGLHFHPSEFEISDQYATILTVVSYPKYISPGYLSSLTSMAGIKIVVVIVWRIFLVSVFDKFFIYFLIVLW